MLKSSLIALVLVAAAALPGLAANEVPFTIEKGFIIVSAKAKKDIPITAAIFTGSSYSYFNGDSLKRLRLQLSYTNDTAVTGTSSENALVFADVPGVVVGDEKPVEVKMRDRSFDAMVKAIGRNIDVILGADYFDGRIVQFDFAKRVIRFLDKAPVEYGSASSSSSPSGAVRLIFKMDEHYQTFYGNTFTLPVGTEVSFNGTKLRTLFNTGVAYPISISPFANKQYSFGPSPDKDSTAKIELRSLGLNGYEMADVPALLVGKGTGWDENEIRYAAVIGLGVMQNFTVTFDWKEKRIVLER